MNGLTITNLVNEDRRLARIFRGVFAADTLPAFLSSCTSHAFVVNTHPHYKSGEHWIAIFITPFKKAIYFDSFGLAPWQPEICKFIQNNSLTLVYNSTPIQSLISRTCGLFCVYFLQAMSKGASLTQMLSAFNPFDPVYNELYIQRLFHYSSRE